MASFLIVYDRGRGALLRLDKIADQQTALKQRFTLERKYEGNSDIEVVVLVAESEQALRETHARYFTTFGDLMRSMSPKAV